MKAIKERIIRVPAMGSFTASLASSTQVAAEWVTGYSLVLGRLPGDFTGALPGRAAGGKERHRGGNESGNLTWDSSASTYIKLVPHSKNAHRFSLPGKF